MSDRWNLTRLILTALLLCVIGVSGVINHAAASAEQVVWALECDSDPEWQAQFDSSDTGEDLSDYLVDGIFIHSLAESALSATRGDHSFVSFNASLAVIRGPPA